MTEEEPAAFPTLHFKPYTMQRFIFNTIWEIENTPVEAVWEAIYQVLEWPRWWKGVLEVTEIEKGDKGGVGSVKKFVWKSILPYRISFLMRTTQVDHLKYLEGIAFGDLEGKGQWFFKEEKSRVVVQYDWQVDVTKKWMSIISPVFKPLLIWNHNVVMRWGAQGLSHRLGAKVKVG